MITFETLLNKKVVAIYGNNNSGKTFTLQKFGEDLYNKQLQQLFEKKESLIPFIYLSVNRVQNDFSGIIPLKLEIIAGSSIEQRKNSMTHRTTTYYQQVRELILSNLHIKAAINAILTRTFNINYKYNSQELYSDGIMNCLNIICEVYYMILSYSAVDFLKFTANDLIIANNTKFILMIDELELYLHLKSQTNFLDQLIRTFPSMNLIFTTHSSLLISRIKEVELFEVQNKILSLSSAESQYYKDIEVINRDLFDVNPFPDKFQKLLDDISKIKTFTKTEIEQLHKRFIEIKQEYPNLTSKYINIFLYFFQKNHETT